MTEVTLKEVWLWMFNFGGAIRLTDAVWVFNILAGLLFFKVERKGFWHYFGLSNMILGGLHFLVRILIAI